MADSKYSASEEIKQVQEVQEHLNWDQKAVKSTDKTNKFYNKSYTSLASADFIAPLNKSNVSWNNLIGI